MYRRTRHALLVSGVLICVLALMASTAAAELATTDHAATLHFQTTRAASNNTTRAVTSNNTTVTNVLTVRTTTISLGSTLEAQGRVTAGTRPLANAVVALHLGDIVVATTQTNATGAYQFSVPVSTNYFPAVLSGGATVYSVASPLGSPSVRAPSGVTHLTVDVLPFYALLAVIVVIVLIIIFLYTRRFRGRPTEPKEKKAQPPASESAATEKTATPPSEPSAPQQPEELREHGIAVPMTPPSEPVSQPEPETPAASEAPAAPLVPPEETAPAEARPEEHAAEPSERTAEPPEATVSEVSAENATLVRARELFSQGSDCQAVNTLYDDAISALVTASGVTIAPHMTYWERYDAIETALPEVREPLRRLTLSYELCHYRDKPLVKEDQDAALEAFRSITELVDKRAHAQ